MNQLKNPFAQVDGSVVHVDQAGESRGPFICPGCAGSLHYVRESKPHSRTGTRRRPHFAHASAECSTGLETGLHLWAKEIIAKHRTVSTPDYVISHMGKLYPFETPIEVADVRLEPWQDGLRPDLLIVGLDGSNTHIEIFVTHEADCRKLDLLEERNLSSLEIDLSKLRLDELDEQALTDAILISAPRQWLHHAKARDWETDASDMWTADVAMHARLIAENVSIAPTTGPSPTEARLLENFIADYGLDPFVGRDVGGAHWFALSNRHWQAKILKALVTSRADLIGDLWISTPKANRFDVYDARRDPELLPLLQPWPGQRTDIDASDPYVMGHVEEHYPAISSPSQLVRNYITLLMNEPDREGHPIGRRLLDPPEGYPHGFRIYRPWADYVLRKKHLLNMYLKAGRRRPLREEQFRTWYTTKLTGAAKTPRAITAAGGPDFVRLIARIEAIINMLNGGWAVDDLMGIEEASFRDHMRDRAVQPHPTGNFLTPSDNPFYCCSSMNAFARHQNDVVATLTVIADQRLGYGASKFLNQADEDLGGLSPLEFVVDVPTMQFAMAKLPPPPEAQGRRRLW